MDSGKVRVGACILAADVAKMVSFYRDTLGFETDWDGQNFAEIITASGKLSFWIYSREEFAKSFQAEYVPPKGINTTFEIGIWVPTYADVDAEYEKLEKLDLEFPAGPPVTYPFGIRNFYVADPEGNLLEIGSDSPV